MKDLRDNIYAHSLWVRIVNSKKSKEKGAGRCWRFGHGATKAQFLSVFNNHPGSFKFKGLTSSQFWSPFINAKKFSHYL